MSVFLLLVSALAVTLLQRLYYLRAGLKHLTYERAWDSDAAFEGDSVTMLERVSNSGRIPLPWVRAESRWHEALGFVSGDKSEKAETGWHRSVFYLSGRSRVTRRQEVSCLKRACIRPESTVLTVADIFCTGMREKYIYQIKPLYIYPRPIAHGELPFSARRFQGDVEVKRFILPDPMLVEGIREYRRSDPLKDIHWGATAHSGELKVKVRSHTVDPRVMIMLNTASSGYEASNEAEHLIRLAASLAMWAYKNGLEFGFISNATLPGQYGARPVRLAPACSEAHLEQFMRTLAIINTTPRMSAATLFDAMERDGAENLDIALLSQDYSAELLAQASRLAARGNIVSHIATREVTYDG